MIRVEQGSFFSEEAILNLVESPDYQKFVQGSEDERRAAELTASEWRQVRRYADRLIDTRASAQTLEDAYDDEPNFFDLDLSLYRD